MRLSPYRGPRTWVLRVLAASLGAAGCGASTGKVSGKVLYNGTPLKGGTVDFIPADGSHTRTSQIAEDGSYSVEKVPAGDAKITVETKSLAPAGKGPAYSPPKDMVVPGGYKPQDSAEMAKRYVPIPDKYADVKTTDLTFPVKSGSQPYDIELK